MKFTTRIFWRLSSFWGASAGTTVRGWEGFLRQVLECMGILKSDHKSQLHWRLLLVFDSDSVGRRRFGPSSGIEYRTIQKHYCQHYAPIWGLETESKSMDGHDQLFTLDPSTPFVLVTSPLPTAPSALRSQACLHATARALKALSALWWLLCPYTHLMWSVTLAA